MQIDKQLISRLEELARLELSPEEQDALREDLNEILTMVEKLQELDLDDVEPLVYISSEADRRRPDVVQGQMDREQAMANAPQTDGEHFLVPKVIDIQKEKKSKPKRH